MRLRNYFHVFLSASFFLLLLSTQSSLSAQEQTRVWSDATGSFSAEAEFIRFDDTKVVLKKTNGVIISVPASMLSNSDREFLREMKNEISPKIELEATSNHVVLKAPMLDASQPDVAPPSQQKFSTASFENSQPKGKLSARQISNLVDSYSAESELEQKLETLQQLSLSWPQQDDSQLVVFLANCLKSQEPGVRSAALKCLASNAPQESFSHILSGTKDKDYNVRWTSFELMGQVKDPRSIKHLIERINGADSRQVNATLAKFGSSVEEYVVAMLSDSSVSTRQAACTLLSKIGTKTGLVSLKRMIMKEDSLRVRLYASDAIDTIQRRIKLEGLLSH